MYRVSVPYTLIISMALLSGCGGGSSQSPVAPDPAPAPPPAKSKGLLVTASSSAALGESVKAGILSSSYLNASGQLVSFPAPCSTCSPTPVEGDAGGAPSYSRTNIQEEGVDEADIVKYDGNLLYQFNAAYSSVPLPSSSTPAPPGAYQARIDLWQTNASPASANHVGSIELDAEKYGNGGLYLTEDSQGKALISVGNVGDNGNFLLYAEPYYWQNGKTHVQRWAADNADSTQAQWSISVDGSLLGSRRIDNVLYLITRFSPVVDDVIAYPTDQTQVDANREAVNKTPAEKLLPMLTINGNSRALFNSDDCLVVNKDYTELPAPPSDGSIVTITAIDISAPEQPTSLCMSTWTSGFYMSRKSVYLTANLSDHQTIVHKIALADAKPEYRGSGAVPGYIGTSHPSFMMGEKDDALMVFSSYWPNNDFGPMVADVSDESESDSEAQDNRDAIAKSIEEFGEHRLTTLVEASDSFALVNAAQLPNANRPARIGKNGEQIYSARFTGDRAYVVTFRTVDPLYAFDVSDPKNPRLEGELELPGVSNFLQPLGERYLLGIGQDVIDDGRGLNNGVKVALFDVSDATKPIEAGHQIIGKRGSRSPAEYDHLALSLLQTDTGYRLALPIERHATETPDTRFEDIPWHAWTDSGLYQFTIDTSAGSLNLDGTLLVQERTPDTPEYQSHSLYNSRSVLHDNAVFFSVDNTVISRSWGQQANP